MVSKMAGNSASKPSIINLSQPDYVDNSTINSHRVNPLYSGHLKFMGTCML